MWLMTTRGFYSAVEKKEDGVEGVTVRARNKSDIDRLKDLIPDAKPFKEKYYTDYAWRLRCSKLDWARAVAVMALEIDYSNFKDEVKRRRGSRVAAIYGRVWGVLLDLETGRRKAFSWPTGYSSGAGSSAHSILDVMDDEVENSLAVRQELDELARARYSPKNRPAGTRTRPKAKRRRQR